MPDTSLTLTYDALLSTTLFNYAPTIEDNISKENALLYVLKQEGAWKTESDIGDRMQVGLMYELGEADSYSGYDVLVDTPMNGVTSAFWPWRQASVPITISGLEEKKNTGEARIVSLLETKTKQAELGLQAFFTKGLLWGSGGQSGGSIKTPYVSTINGSTFIDPLPKLVAFDPTASVTVGEINQLTNPWWRNQAKDCAATTYAMFLKELEHERNNAGKGPGGFPNLCLADQATYELYCAALRAKHENPSYAKADFPFAHVAFYGKPVVWDELMPDWANSSTTQSTASGTWLYLNTKFIEVKVHSGTNFAPTPFMNALVNGQDAKKAYILWLGGIGMSNRRKQGVLAGIDTTIAS